MKILLDTMERLSAWNFRRSGTQSHWFDTSVGKVHAFSTPGTGSLPPIVMLHGLGASALSYAPLVQLLRPYTEAIISVDTPAHGSSDLPQQELSPMTLFQGIQECLDALEISSFHLIGNSLGGGMATRYTLHAPERVRSLVLLSPAGAPTLEEERADFIARFEMERRKDARLFTEQLLYKVPWYGGLIASIIYTRFQQPAIQAFVQHVKLPHIDAEYTFTPEQLQSLKQPIFLMWGKADGIMPPSHLQYYRTHLPEHTELHEPHHVGHSPHVERPQFIADSILQFWR